MTALALLTVNAVELLRQPGTRRQRRRRRSPSTPSTSTTPRLAGDVAVDVTAESTLDDIVVAGTLTVAWQDTCRRCLRPLAGTAASSTSPSATRMPGDAVDPEAFPIENGQLDLGPMVRENVLLGVPDAPLCRDDCPGPVPGLRRRPAGRSRATATPAVRDERWAVLDQLRLDD